jgi:DNA-binding MarR family transcriptional regulator
MPVGEVQMFLLVALNEGASMTDLAIEADMRKATASRYLLDLSDKNRLGQPGFGLVSREVDPQELRRNVYSLTPKGRSLVNDLINQK